MSELGISRIKPVAFLEVFDGEKWVWTRARFLAETSMVGDLIGGGI